MGSNFRNPCAPLHADASPCRGARASSGGRLQVWALALLLASQLSATAYAQAPATQVFIGTLARGDDAQPVAGKVDAALRVGYAAHQTRPVTGPPQSPPIPKGALGDVQKLLSTARSQFSAAEFSDAVGTCDDAIARFESTFAYAEQSDAWDAYAELMLVRALALRRLDKKGPADRTLGALAAQRPSYVPDPSLVPPKVTERYAVIKKRLEEIDTPTLTIQSVPAGADVLVDGRRAGKTPLALDALPAGPHYVAVSAGSSRVDEYVVLKTRPLTVRAVFEDETQRNASVALDLLKIGATEAAYIDAASRAAPITLAAVVTREDDGSFTIIAGRTEGKTLGVAAVSVASDLSDLDDIADLVADITSEADADLETAPGPLKTAFLRGVDAPPVPRADEAEEGSSIVGPVIGGVAAAAALAALGIALVGVATYFVITAPSNPGGTDVVIDASRL